jgi:DNA relaxase NicK
LRVEVRQFTKKISELCFEVGGFAFGVGRKLYNQQNRFYSSFIAFSARLL